jgi:nucleotide-binding universal stress UspA family protein
MAIKKILLPTDLSAGAPAAQKLALSLAKLQGAEVLFFHVVLSHENDYRPVGDFMSDFFADLEAEAEQKLDAETSRLREQGTVARYEVVRAPSAFEAILRTTKTWKPDLIVMATHGASGMPRWFLGSVAEKVVRHAPCPVATIRPDDAREVSVDAPERILVPIDFSDNSRRALEMARGLIPETGSLVLHHVVLNPTLAGLAPEAHLRLFSEEPTLPDRIRTHMDEWMGGRAFDAEVTESDDIAGAIIEMAEAKASDIIVMGTRGRTGVDYFLTGSVAEKIVRSSPIPVLAVK